MTLWGELGLPARAAILGGLFFIEKIFLTHFVDLERANAALGLGADLRVAQHFAFRFMVALVAALIVFALARPQPPWPAGRAPRLGYPRPVWVAAHLALVSCLAWLSSWLFPPAPPAISFGATVSLWLVCSAAAVFCVFAAMAPIPLWLQAARALGKLWLYAGAVALAAASSIPLTQDLWKTTASATFDLVRLMLLPILPGLAADPVTRVIGTSRFSVEILDFCSGLEGMSLILVFATAWLWYFRREYRFPRALLLIPVGMGLMFGLNSVRIAVLVLIGNAGYPETAVYGFHSQAGWIAFNAVAVGIAVWTQRSRWLSRNEQQLERDQSDNPTALFLVPLLSILAAGMLSHAISGRFEWFYPLRLIAGCAAIWIYRTRLAALPWRWSWRGVLLGVGVFVVWIVAAHLVGADARMPQALAAASPWLRWSWIGCRVVAAVVTVPLAEELAFRGFLMRRLQHRDFDLLPYQQVGWLAAVASSVVFGLVHGGMWLAGSIAGFGYALIVKVRGELAEGVAAHMTTNLLVATAALGLNDWSGF